MTKRDDTSPLPEPGHSSKTLTRRRLLKGAVATAPAIATLPSGAALARSSNLITASSPAEAVDSLGRTLCLDWRSGTLYSGDGFDDALDLGDPPSGWVTAISERDYRVAANAGSTLVSEADMCTNGGTYYYRATGWQQVDVPRGMLVSATALASFGGGITITHI